MSSSKTTGDKRSGRRVLILAVVGSLSVSALFAIGILLLGSFGQTEGRILGTTGLIAGYGLLALPAGILIDQARLKSLAVTVLVLAAAGFLLALAAVWTSGAQVELGKTVATVTAFGVASTQASALASRRRQRDPVTVRWLFAASIVLALLVAALISAGAWATIDRQGYYRVVAALAVLDVLLVVLQPILALTRPATSIHRLRVVVEPGGAVDTEVEAPDFAAAAAKVIRAQERDGCHVLRLERLGSGDRRQPRPRPGAPGSRARRRAARAPSARAAVPDISSRR